MAGKPDIERMVRDHNTAGLERALRYGQDAGVRRRAAKGAGRLGDAALVEALNRSLREDPDIDVQEEAYTALREILGSRAQEVVDSYNGGPRYEDEWLQVESDEELDESVFWEKELAAGPRTGRPNLARILEEEDAVGLEEAMRFGPDVKVRQLAVRAAGQWGNYELVEALTRSLREDPEEVVRKEAYEALYEILGNRADEVIASYEKGADYADEWISNAPLHKETEMKIFREELDDTSINALFMIAYDRRDERKAARAVQELAKISSTRSVEALISLALHADSQVVRQEAEDQLRTFYGDDLEEVLDSYRNVDGFGDELEELILGQDSEDADEEEGDAGSWRESPHGEGGYGRVQPGTPSTVLKEEGVNPLQVVMVAIGVVVIIALVVMYLGR